MSKDLAGRLDFHLAEWIEQRTVSPLTVATSGRNTCTMFLLHADDGEINSISSVVEPNAARLCQAMPRHRRSQWCRQRASHARSARQRTKSTRTRPATHKNVKRRIEFHFTENIKSVLNFRCRRRRHRARAYTDISSIYPNNVLRAKKENEQSCTDAKLFDCLLSLALSFAHFLFPPRLSPFMNKPIVFQSRSSFSSSSPDAFVY